MLVTLLGASALALLTGGLVWWKLRARLETSASGGARLVFELATEKLT